MRRYFFILFFVAGCSSDVKVDIADATARSLYIQILDKKGIEYTIDDDNIIYVKSDPDKLFQEMKEYDDLIKEKLINEGVIFP